MTRTRLVSRVLSLVAGLIGIATAHDAGAATPAVVVSFDPALAQLPESITAGTDGALYASNLPGGIQKIDPRSGTFTTVATVPLPSGAALTGIKMRPDGMLYVDSASFSASPDGALVWRVSPRSGAVHPLSSLDANGFPDDLVFQPDGSRLVTDGLPGPDLEGRSGRSRHGLALGSAVRRRSHLAGVRRPRVRRRRDRLGRDQAKPLRRQHRLRAGHAHPRRAFQPGLRDDVARPVDPLHLQLRHHAL